MKFLCVAFLAANLLSRGWVVQACGTTADPTPCVCTGSTIPLDVVFLVDLTGSFGDDIAAFKSSAVDIIEHINTIGPDAQIAVASFRDYPIVPFGESDDWPYKLHTDLTDVTSSLTSAINSMSANGGWDGPESQLTGLLGVTKGVPSFGARVSFRLGSQRIIVLWTDAPFHHPGYPSGWPGPTWADTISALTSNSIKVVGLSAYSSTDADLVKIANATGAVAGSGGVSCGTTTLAPGTPIVCPASGVSLSSVFRALVAGAVGCVIEDVEYKCDKVPIPSLPVAPALNYTKGSISFNVSENAGMQAMLKFKYNANALENVTLPKTFGVVVTDNSDGLCGGEILYKSDNAHLPVSGRVRDNNTTHIPIIADINVLDMENPLLTLKFDPDKFEPNWYTEGFCPPGTSLPCGLVNVCVEFQAFLCKRKVDFVDVNLQMYVDLTVTCTDEKCGQLILRRDDIVNDTGLVDPGDIECKPCLNDAGVKFDTKNITSQLTVAQGASVLSCVEMKTAGACVRKINYLDLNVERAKDLWKRYCIISDNTTEECLFLVDPKPNPDYNPITIAGYDADDASVRYLVPGEEFQELNPGASVKAHYSGSARIGFGCCCNDPPCAGCGSVSRTLRSRHLQDGKVVDVPFVGDAFPVTFDKKAKTTSSSCTGFALLCWLKKLFHMITFGLFK